MNERDADRLAEKARRHNATRRFVRTMDTAAKRFFVEMRRHPDRDLYATWARVRQEA